MIRRRTTNNGLPWRVYERFGKRVWRVYFQPLQGPRVTLFLCHANDVTRAEARKRGKLRYDQLYAGMPEATSELMTFKRLGDLYFDWQSALPENDDGKKADSTIDENRREFTRLCVDFGDTLADEIEAPDWFRYQDKRRKGGAGAKANKELALASAIMEWGRLRGVIGANTARIKRVKTKPLTRRVTLAEIDAVLPIARKMGPGATIQALCARTALLCLRRPEEIRRLRVSQIKDEGILFTAGKRKSGEAERKTIIEFSPALKATIDEALAVKRRVHISPYVFGTLSGGVYTKSGWGASWRRLMENCAKKIEGFESFTLRDCRPGGVTSKKERKDDDVQDATLHKDSRMIEQIYDRRKDRRAKPSH